MTFARSFVLLAMASVWIFGCGSPMDGADGGRDAGLFDSGIDAASDEDAALPDDDAGSDAGSDAGPSCLTTHVAGDRYEVGDRCNFCTCLADGSEDCSDRTCLEPSFGGCDYDGTMHGYGERFPSTDGCNECVCAASGLACTRRTATCPSTPDEGAILLDFLDQACGDDPAFTTEAVLSGLPRGGELTLPFHYERMGPLYPETLPDTALTLRIVRDQAGYSACRIPMPGQEAIDLEVLVEWYTADGAFDETFHAYLRRNRGGFTNVWTVAASVEPGTLNGTYTPGCPIFRGFSFDATLDFDGSAHGAAYKTCEGDISLVIASFDLPPT